MTYLPSTRALAGLALVLPLSLSACSDDGEGETLAVETSGEPTTTDPSTSGDGDGDPSTTDPSTSGDGDGDPSTTGDGDGDATGDGDGDATGDGDGDATGDGDGDPGPVDTSTYSAVIMPGGLDRVVITRVNIDEPNCTRMTLWSPQNSDMFDFDMPQDWAVEEVLNWKQGFCPDDNADPDTFPDEGTGTISFPALDGLGIYPCAINIDIELDMNSDPPSSTIWSTQGIMVEGVNCG